MAKGSNDISTYHGNVLPLRALDPPHGCLNPRIVHITVPAGGKGVAGTGMQQLSTPSSRGQVPNYVAGSPGHGLGHRS